MEFEKKVLYRWNMPYALGKVTSKSQTCIVAATEDRGPIVISRPPYLEAEVFVPGPGGCMSLVAGGKDANQMFAIMGCFLGYKFQEAAIYEIGDQGPKPALKKIANLPFAHRMEVLSKEGESFLVLANLASNKLSADDWSQAGTVYGMKLGNKDDNPNGDLFPIVEGIHKNHGFLKTSFEGQETILFSGSEGLYSLNYERGSWLKQLILPWEVSEIAVFDLDNDGQQELITIEPFHGHKLVVYKKQDTWTKVWEAELSYGHCVLAQLYMGLPTILVSNRSGTKDLVMYQFPKTKNKTWPEPHKITVDQGVGAANMLFLGEEEGAIFSTNQVPGELVKYEPLT